MSQGEKEDPWKKRTSALLTEQFGCLHTISPNKWTVLIHDKYLGISRWKLRSKSTKTLEPGQSAKLMPSYFHVYVVVSTIDQQHFEFSS
jgi:hypothetical protein